MDGTERELAYRDERYGTEYVRLRQQNLERAEQAARRNEEARIRRDLRELDASLHRIYFGNRPQLDLDFSGRLSFPQFLVNVLQMF